MRRSYPPKTGIGFYVNDFSLSEPHPWLVPTESWIDASHVQSREIADPLVVDLKSSGAKHSKPFTKKSWPKSRAPGHKAVVAAEAADSAKAGPLAPISRALMFGRSPVGWSYGFAEVRQGSRASLRNAFSIFAIAELQPLRSRERRPAERARFESDAKEIHEHELVVETMRARLAALGDVRSSDRAVLDVGDMLHFITRFEVEGSAIDPDSAIAPCTPLLHRRPSRHVPEAMARLLSWRERLGVPRHFGAPFAAICDGNVHAVVAIRGLLGPAIRSHCRQDAGLSPEANWNVNGANSPSNASGCARRWHWNERFRCHEIARQLAGIGVRESCVCGGARNAALIAVLADSRGLRLWSFPEERCASFFALGRAMAREAPVAVVTTSGTAAAELLPAVIELTTRGFHWSSSPPTGPCGFAAPARRRQSSSQPSSVHTPHRSTSRLHRLWKC